MDVTLPRETDEFIPVPVYRDEVLTTTFDTALTRWPARPVAWVPSAVIDGVAGVMATGLTHGTWQLWVRVGSTVIAAGTIWVE
jgi:hypothetical protein